MTIKESPGFSVRFKKLIAKDAALEEKIERQLKLLTIDRKHPSLRLHKIRSKHGEAWSISVDMSLRIVFVYREYGILLVDIGSYEEIY